MITHVRFCLSYDLLNAILSPSKCVYFNGNLYCCNGHSRRKCYVTFGLMHVFPKLCVWLNSDTSLFYISNHHSIFLQTFSKCSVLY